MRTANERSGWTEESVDHAAQVLAVAGELTPAVGERLAQRIRDVADLGQRGFVIDLVAVEAMSPEAMRPILCAARYLRALDVRVVVVFDPLLALFAVDGLDDLYDVAVTREDALAALERRH